MIILLKLKSGNDYKYINMALIRYFERYSEDETKTELFFGDGKSIVLDVDADLISEEIAEIMETFMLSEGESYQQKEEKKH